MHPVAALVAEGGAVHVYFAVEDVEASSEAVTAHGGAVEYPAFDTPFGRIASCRDHCGTPLTLTQPAAT